VIRIAKRNLKKQSQFAKGQNDVKSIITMVYVDFNDRRQRKTKPIQSQTKPICSNESAGNSKMTEHSGNYRVGWVRLTKTHRLVFSAVLAINRNSFAAKTIGHFIGLIYRGNRRFFAEVYSLADRRIAMLLKSRLHPDVPLRLDIVCPTEDPAHIGGDTGYFLNTAGPGDLFYKLFAV